MSRRQLAKFAGIGATFVAAGIGTTAWASEDDENQRRGDGRNRAWRAGDHHVHSEYSEPSTLR